MAFQVQRRCFGPPPFIGCASASAECRCLSSSSSMVFGMYPETYSLCSTSTECTRFITHLNFETDMGAHTERSVCVGSAEHHYAHGARREMDLHGSRLADDMTTRCTLPIRLLVCWS
ncbi:uncharacterized protein ARMOST_19911 [Armillaria ostoyae]|uniref:Uncharacterized protein n=1 Tax=Armillaria ostoyae TaxID=47428 RepID=A0A284S5V6_ARMOS|nr:uncharacterized protein ARMOST_19911 [Armillaria ostoyae]